MEPKFKIGDHISHYDSYWGRRTGVITKFLGIVCNVDGRGKDNYAYSYVDDVTKTEQFSSEKKLKKCRTPKA